MKEFSRNHSKTEKVAGVRTEYRDKKVGKNGGWKGRILDYENNRWLPKHENS